MTIRAVIYDHDGTLVHSLNVVVAATNTVLNAHGAQSQSAEVVIAGMVYPTGPRLGMLLNESDIQRQKILGDEFYAAAQALGPVHAFVYPGIMAAVKTLSGKQVQQAVVSNNQGVFIRRVLAHLELAPYLPVMLGEEDFATPKPHPSGLVLAAQRLGMSPAESIYVGDTIGDLQAATAAGMRCIGVSWGITPASVLNAQPFAVVVDTPEQMVQWLAGQ